MEPLLGEIRIFSFNKIPDGWAACNGQLLNIQQNQGLYTLLGNKFGGDGTKTFALPNLQGATTIGAGNTYAPGATGGVESVALSAATTPVHYHTVNVYDVNASKATFSTVLAAITAPTPGNLTKLYPVNGYVPPSGGYGPPPQPIELTASAVSTEGAGAAHPNMQPYLTLNICMATSGTYPVNSN